MSRIRYKRQYPDFVPNNWTECFRLPLHLSDYCWYAWDANGNMALSSFDLVYDKNGDFASGEKERINHIIESVQQIMSLSGQQEMM